MPVARKIINIYYITSTSQNVAIRWNNNYFDSAKANERAFRSPIFAAIARDFPVSILNAIANTGHVSSRSRWILVNGVDLKSFWHELRFKQKNWCFWHEIITILVLICAYLSQFWSIFCLFAVTAAIWLVQRFSEPTHWVAVRFGVVFLHARNLIGLAPRENTRRDRRARFFKTKCITILLF